MSLKRFNYSFSNDTNGDNATLEAGTLIYNNAGHLRLHDGITPGGNPVGEGTSNSANEITSGTYAVTLDSSGILNLSTASTILGSGTDPNVYIETLTTNTTSVWTFGTNGVLTLPVETPVIQGGGTGTDVTVIATTGTNTATWVFGADGNLTFPDLSVQTTAYGGVLTNEVLTAGTGTVLDITKQLHILGGNAANTSTYILPGGTAIGQIMYFLPNPNYTDDAVNSVIITVDNATVNNGGNYQLTGTHYWSPFSPDTLIYQSQHRSGVPTPYAIWDGLGWNLSGGTTN